MTSLSLVTSVSSGYYAIVHNAPEKMNGKGNCYSSFFSSQPLGLSVPPMVKALVHVHKTEENDLLRFFSLHPSFKNVNFP